MSDWRENIHNTLKHTGIELSQVIIDCIDAAYVAGLDDNEAARQRLACKQ